MAAAPVSFPMKSRLPAAVGALALFGGGAVLCVAARDALFGGALGLLVGGGAAVMAVVALVAILNLAGHEGWAVVLGDDALELPGAPVTSRRRERIPYASISFVGLSPDPPAAPEAIIFHVSPGPQIRWIRQADLDAGHVEAIARLLIERVSACRGPGAVARVFHT